MKLTVRLQDDTVGQTIVDKMDIEGSVRMVRLQDENGNFIYREGIVVEVLETKN